MSFPSVNILIVEDEAIVATELANTLLEENYQVVGTAQDGRAALQLFDEHPVDLLLGDIHLPGSINGLQLVQKIKAIGYGSLPINEPVLNRETILQTQGYIFIKQEYAFVKIRLDDITYVESDNNYIVVHLATKRYTLRLSLSAFLDKVMFNNLVRIHRSYAVNIGQVDFFNEQGVGIGKKEIPLSRQYRAAFLHQFTIR